MHCGEAVTVDKNGSVIGFHKELTCHKSPRRVHEVNDLQPGEEGWVRNQTGELVWVLVNKDGSHTPVTPPPLNPPQEGQPIAGDPNPPHPLYPERITHTVYFNGVAMPGWFTGEACIWTGGSSPRCIGPFDTVTKAMEYAASRHPGAQFFPYSKPGDLPE